MLDKFNFLCYFIKDYSTTLRKTRVLRRVVYKCLKRFCFSLPRTFRLILLLKN